MLCNCPAPLKQSYSDKTLWRPLHPVWSVFCPNASHSNFLSGWPHTLSYEQRKGSGWFLISLQTISARGQIIERELVRCRELESASGSTRSSKSFSQVTAFLRLADVEGKNFEIPTTNGCFTQERTVAANEAMSESRTERAFVKFAPRSACGASKLP